MSKKIDLSRSVHEICREHPEVVEIMKELGFKEIANPGMLNTVGRYMTIPRGARMRDIPMSRVKEVFIGQGYEIIDGSEQSERADSQP